MDLISREQVVKAIDDFTKGKPLYDYPWQIIEVINNVPSAGKIGRWLESRESSLRPFMCSNCGCIYDVDTVMGKPIWNYCPHCGSRMVSDEDKH